MSKDFHESFRAGELKLPSERSTGLVFTVVALIVAALWRKDPFVPWVALGIAAVLALVSFVAPKVLKPLNVVWFRFGLLLHRIVNPLVMFIMFVVVFVPAGLIMRIWHDPLRSKRGAAGSTYWRPRKADPERSASMANQF
jgi:hypothetical protein